jgi:hypothetical protein
LAQNCFIKSLPNLNAMSRKKQSTDLSKQKLSGNKPEGKKVVRAESTKSKSDELADKSEGFGASQEELNQYRLHRRDSDENEFNKI